jgi:hypothetical protein
MVDVRFQQAAFTAKWIGFVVTDRLIDACPAGSVATLAIDLKLFPMN